MDNKLLQKNKLRNMPSTTNTTARTSYLFPGLQANTKIMFPLMYPHLRQMVVSIRLMEGFLWPSSVYLRLSWDWSKLLMYNPIWPNACEPHGTLWNCNTENCETVIQKKIPCESRMEDRRTILAKEEARTFQERYQGVKLSITGWGFPPLILSVYQSL